MGSSCVRPAPSPTTSPFSWGPAALGSTSSSMKVPLCLSLLIWTPGVESLSCHVLSTGRGPSPQEVRPSLPGHHHHACLHSSKCAGVFLGNPPRGPSNRLQHTLKRKEPGERGDGSHSNQNIGPSNGTMFGYGGRTDHLREIHPQGPALRRRVRISPWRNSGANRKKRIRASSEYEDGHSRSPDLSGSSA